MLFLFYCAMITIMGCNDYSINKVVITDPELVVYPAEINFGHLESGHESGQASFAVINAGDEELIISKPELIAGNSRFNLDGGLEEEYTILPGEVLDFNVYYEPATYESNGAIIRFSSNDEDEKEFEVLLTGFGDAPVMSVFPEDFDYGDISIGCDNEERITIRNDGNLPLIVESITQMVTQPANVIMEFGSLPQPPWELIPSQEIDFLVSYAPNDIGYDESVIRIEGNDPATPMIETLQYGDGDVEQWFVETHIQEEIALLDVIFVIDNSGSMAVFQQELSNQMTNFMNVFISSGADYHLAFVTTDSGRFRGSGSVFWIDSTFPNPVDWAQGVITGISVGGSPYEKGIEFAKAALEGDAAPGGIFWRDDATMVIIYVSDEPDFSIGSWTAYTSFFDNIKSSVDLMRHFAVIGDYPSGCQFPWGASFRNVGFGSGYWDMTQRYNGDWYSICATDWGNQMQSLANTVTTRKTFQLEEHDPIENTILVTVNGQMVSEWSYDMNSNSVVFSDGSIPEPNQTIMIEYAVWGCGDE
jgi:hypothetical protein